VEIDQLARLAGQRAVEIVTEELGDLPTLDFGRAL
jgi:hypothetical protein